MPAWIGYAFVGLASVFAGWSGWVFYDRVTNTDEDNNNASGGTASSVESTGNTMSSGNENPLAKTDGATQTTSTDSTLIAGQVDSITFTVSDANGFSTASIVEELENQATDGYGGALSAFEKSTVTSSVTGVTQHFAKAGIFTEVEVTIAGQVKVPAEPDEYGYHQPFLTTYDDDGYYAPITFEYQIV